MCCDLLLAEERFDSGDGDFRLQDSDGKVGDLVKRASDAVGEGTSAMSDERVPAQLTEKSS